MDVARRVWRAIAGRSIQNLWRRRVFYLSYDFPGEVVKIPGGVRLPKVKLEIKENSNVFVLNAYSRLKIIVEMLNASVESNSNGIQIKFQDLTLTPTTEEEIFIIQEVFVNGSYNYVYTKPSVVIDIGMNVGFASLFFAQKATINSVYSFEPFLPTYEQATLNISANPQLGAKIKTHAYGLSDKDESMVVSYTYENKGQVGVHGVDLIRSTVEQKEQAVIELRSASTELAKIFESHPTQTFLLKVDCEGSEYAIFQDLSKKKLLERVDLIFIEWHERGPEELLKILEVNGFRAFFQQTAERKVGMIYAVKG